MFDDERVPVLLRKLSLKLEADKDGEDDDRHRICECTFREASLTYARASRIRLPIIGHCFGKDKLPLWNVHEVHFQPPDETYTATLAPAYDAPDLVALELATLKRVRVWRSNQERRDLALEFVIRHRLQRGDAKDLAALLHAWESGAVALTLTTIQIPMPFEGADDDAPRGSRRRTH